MPAPSFPGFLLMEAGYFRQSDSSGPYIFDGTTMKLIGAGGIDSTPAAINVTTQDTGSTATPSTPVTGGSSINSITGAPTANSVAVYPVSGQELARTQLSGVWTGTLTFEVSLDGGVTYQSAASHVSGTSQEVSAVNGNGQFITLVAGATHFRVRATAAMTGSAAVKPVFSAAGGLVKINGGLVFARFDGAVPVNLSGAIVAGNTAQVLAAANPSRRGAWVQNLSAGDLWVYELGTAMLDQPSLRIPTNGYYEYPLNGCGLGALSIIGATTGQKFSARQW